METMGGELVMHNEVNPPSERRNVGLNAGPASLTSQSALRCVKENPDYKGQTYKQHLTVTTGMQYLDTPLLIVEHQWQIQGIETPVIVNQLLVNQ